MPKTGGHWTGFGVATTDSFGWYDSVSLFSRWILVVLVYIARHNHSSSGRVSMTIREQGI